MFKIRTLVKELQERVKKEKFKVGSIFLHTQNGLERSIILVYPPLNKNGMPQFAESILFFKVKTC